MVRNEKHIKLFGNRVKELRNQRNLTQQDLAVLMNTDKSYVGKIETGVIEIKLGTVFNLCKAFEITPKDLFDFLY